MTSFFAALSLFPSDLLSAPTLEADGTAVVTLSPAALVLLAWDGEIF